MVFIKLKRKVKSKKNIFLMIILLLSIVSIYSLKAIDNRIFPSAVEIASHQAKNRINRIVNGSVKAMTEVQNLSSADFYIKTVDERGAINSLSVNTMLINDVCANLSEELTKSIEEVGIGDLEIPVGALLGLKSLSNIGPNYPISVMPSGEAEVDYESSFMAEGINQIHFQIWLSIKASVKIVNPLQEESIIVTRKVSLVNTLIPGEVPSTFFEINK